MALHTRANDNKSKVNNSTAKAVPAVNAERSVRGFDSRRNGGMVTRATFAIPGGVTSWLAQDMTTPTSYDMLVNIVGINCLSLFYRSLVSFCLSSR